MMWLFLAFLAIPLIEISLFVVVGNAIGLWPTLLIVVLTAIAGTALMRSQGLRTLAELRASLDSLQDPTGPLVHGGMILFAGALLLTPGFFTDTLGLLLMIPAVRERAFRAMRRHFRMVTVATAAPGGPRPAGPAPDIIDGEWEEVDPVPPRPTHSPSGWTRH